MQFEIHFTFGNIYYKLNQKVILKYSGLHITVFVQ